MQNGRDGETEYTHLTSIIGDNIVTPLLYDREHLCGPARVTKKLENKISTHCIRGVIRSGPGRGR